MILFSHCTPLYIHSISLSGKYETKYYYGNNKKSVRPHQDSKPYNCQAYHMFLDLSALLLLF